MSILESANAAMPGVGFALGGAIAALSGPRTTFLVASLGIFAIVVVSAFRLGSKWPERSAMSSSDELDAGDDVVLELLPGRRAVQSYSEVKP
jgi:hypothetical protein